MSVDALRFAHASNLRIDVALRGIGPLPDAARRLAADAPTAAWERIVEACVDRDVAFLLLTPRTSIGRLAACDRRVLLNGFRQLSEFEIPVYWSLAPDEALDDPLIDALPDNVTLLTANDNRSSLVREGRVVATFGQSPGDDASVVADRLAAIAESKPPLRIRIARDARSIDAIPESETSDAVRIGEPPLSGEYIACWGATREQTRVVGPDLWVDPGCPVSRTADEPGHAGINIVEWNDGQITEILRVPTASVGWSCCRLGLSRETTREELIERMQSALLEREASDGERLALVEWRIVGSGPEFEALHAAEVQRDLEATIDAIPANRTRVPRVHRWNLRRTEMAATDSVSKRLQDWLAVHAESECAAINQESEFAVPPATVREDAERLLAEWLTMPVRASD